ncbi:MAG: choice-of-anchor Q domain-containing protein [Spirosomataceae bacterium]
MTTTLLKLTAITLLCLSTALTGMAQSPQIKTSHAQNYFRTQTNAVMLVWVKTFTTSDGLQVVLNPDPNFTITRINAPAKWNCNIVTKTCTRTNDGTPAILEFIQVIGTISATAPATMTNSATLTGGGLASAVSSSDPASVYNSSKIVAWGPTSQNRQDNLPTSYGFTSIGIGLRYGMGLQSDGSIVQWGATINDVQTDKPTDNGYLAIAAGSYHSVALASDGSIVQWGRSASGQRTNKPTGTGFIALAATDNGCVALTNEGKIVTWGTLDVTDLPTDASYIAIAAGYNHGIALRTTGSIAQWGANNSGQRTNLPPGGGFKAICSTNYSCYAQRQDGTLLGWGSSNNNAFVGMPTNSVAYFISNQAATGAAGAMYDNGSVVIWGDVFTVVSPAPSTTGFALNSLALGGHGAALLPMANPTVDGGNAQSTLVNTAFAAPLKIKLLDNAGNPIPNINFSFVAPSSGASGTFGNGQPTITVATDANGIASTTFTANGEGGAYNVTASYPGLNVVSFSLTNTLSSPTGTSNPTICANTATALSAGCAIGNVVWYDATGTNVQFTGSPFTTPTLTSNTLYKVACNNGVIQSGFTDVTVTVSPVRLYVNASATGANTGLRWTDAFTDLQSALSVARANPSCVTQIWVAAGTYKPNADLSGNTSPADARTKTFVMVNGVAIYGGFSGMGTETELSQRNWRSNPTILSGNIGDTGIDTDNSYRVINNNFTSGSPLGNTAILDGFIVEKGYANGSFPLNLGAGMWNAYASPTVRNCIFRNNTAASGAGIFNDNSETNVTNCLFTGNSCSVEGAALSNGGGTASAKAINCTFYGNTGGNSTIRNEVNATAISNCILWGNATGVLGGTVSYSIVQGGFSGTGNLNSDPLFVNATGGDFRLQACSPAIDAGTNTGAPATDFEGNVRSFNATGVSNADMGAYEYQSAYNVCSICANITGGIVYVNASASGG